MYTVEFVCIFSPFPHREHMKGGAGVAVFHEGLDNSAHASLPSNSAASFCIPAHVRAVGSAAFMRYCNEFLFLVSFTKSSPLIYEEHDGKY